MTHSRHIKFDLPRPGLPVWRNKWQKWINFCSQRQKWLNSSSDHAEPQSDEPMLSSAEKHTRQRLQEVCTHLPILIAPLKIKQAGKGCTPTSFVKRERGEPSACSSNPQSTCHPPDLFVDRRFAEVLRFCFMLVCLCCKVDCRIFF